MAREREREFIGGDALAVIADADKAHPALFQVNLPPPRPGIQRIFDQFLDHRGRALDHLACGDLVDEDIGKRADGHEGGV